MKNIYIYKLISLQCMIMYTAYAFAFVCCFFPFANRAEQLGLWAGKKGPASTSREPVKIQDSVWTLRGYGVAQAWVCYAGCPGLDDNQVWHSEFPGPKFEHLQLPFLLHIWILIVSLEVWAGGGAWEPGRLVVPTKRILDRILKWTSTLASH